MSLANLIEQLHIEGDPELPSQLFERAERAYMENGTALVDPGWLRSLNAQYGLYPDQPMWQTILDAAAEIRDMPELLQYIYVLHEVCRTGSNAEQLIARFALPAVEVPSPARDFAVLFALLPFIPDLVKSLQGRGVPDDVISATLSEFPDKVRDFQHRRGRPGMSLYTGWLYKFIMGEIIRIGRFNFEMKQAFKGAVSVYRNLQGEYRVLVNHAVLHRSGLILGAAGCEDEAGSYRAEICETKTAICGYPAGKDGRAAAEKIRLDKRDWSCVLTTGDPVLSVHIPALMSLAEDICEASYSQARTIFARCYPDFAFKAICCESWMMDPQLAVLLGRETNLTRFQKKYMPYPTRAQGRAVMDFVFLKPYDTPPEDLPADTSLRRAIKAHYQAGGHIYELGGVFF